MEVLELYREDVFPTFRKDLGSEYAGSAHVGRLGGDEAAFIQGEITRAVGRIPLETDLEVGLGRAELGR